MIQGIESMDPEQLFALWLETGDCHIEEYAELAFKWEWSALKAEHNDQIISEQEFEIQREERNEL